MLRGLRMNRRRRFWHKLTLVSTAGLALHLAAPHRIADACSIAGTATPGVVLGVPLGLSSTEPVPANVASLDATRGDSFTAAGATLYRIPSGTTTITAGGLDIPVSDTPDTTAPTVTLDGAQWVYEAGCSGCAYGGPESSSVTLTVSATDDTASAARISYAVYFGGDEDAARAASEGEPELWVVPDSAGVVWFLLAGDDVPSFAVVRAFDQAGNPSEASAAVAIQR